MMSSIPPSSPNQTPYFGCRFKSFRYKTGSTGTDTVRFTRKSESRSQRIAETIERYNPFARLEKYATERGWIYGGGGGEPANRYYTSNQRVYGF